MQILRSSSTGPGQPSPHTTPFSFHALLRLFARKMGLSPPLTFLLLFLLTMYPALVSEALPCFASDEARLSIPSCRLPAPPPRGLGVPPAAPTPTTGRDIYVWSSSFSKVGPSPTCVRVPLDQVGLAPSFLPLAYTFDPSQSDSSQLFKRQGGCLHDSPV